jgi:hypothetical protein
MTDTPFHRFIVTGVPTAGKSTFSHQLIRKYFIQHICIDPIIEAFENVFPQLGITHDAPTLETHLDVCQKFKPFVFRMIDGLDVDDFVIEGFRLPLEDLHARFPALQYFVFGYPNATPRDRLARVREFDVANWTNDMTDEELLETFAFLIEESKRLQDICGRLGIPFVDTGLEYWPQIDWAMEQAK